MSTLIPPIHKPDNTVTTEIPPIPVRPHTVRTCRPETTLVRTPTRHFGISYPVPNTPHVSPHCSRTMRPCTPSSHPKLATLPSSHPATVLSPRSKSILRRDTRVRTFPPTLSTGCYHIISRMAHIVPRTCDITTLSSPDSPTTSWDREWTSASESD